MILYATKQTIKELNIPMPNELSAFNNIMANKVIKDQAGDELLEWGLKLFYFDGRKCVQTVNFASKLTLFLFDIKNEEIRWIANGIAIIAYINIILSTNVLKLFIKKRANNTLMDSTIIVIIDAAFFNFIFSSVIFTTFVNKK